MRVLLLCRAASLCLLLTCFGVRASAAESQTAPLPAEVVAALARGKVPTEAFSATVFEISSPTPVLAWRTRQQVNPASLMKLVTTYAALDLLGPAWAWTTPVWLNGSLRNPGPEGALEGNLVIKGNGDPKWVLERIWLLLRKVRQAGVRDVRGDILLDRSAFSEAEQSPADFDGEALRPYNVQADALMLNFRSLLLTFTPDPARGVATVVAEPSLAGLRVESSVPLVGGACDAWRVTLKPDISDPTRIRFLGGFPTACGERAWPQAYADPGSYNARLIEAMWREIGGTLTGSVRDGVAPGTRPSFEMASPPLAEVIRDINKFSNNLMAQQLFLSLGLQLGGAGTSDAARAVVRQWLAGVLGERAADIVIDNGSGLSRESRVTADALAQLLLRAWASPVMPEFVSSLPVSGVDGTLRRPSGASNRAVGRAHLKTGSLKDVAAIAGYLLAQDGRRYVVVAVINHPNAAAGKPALDALVEWAARPRGKTAAHP
jgi:D-alanyl-D-alanine carboxypeptidase/D-alanyl-D-alanine-endopeptidase (penicillin-binding protein 4)